MILQKSSGRFEIPRLRQRLKDQELSGTCARHLLACPAQDWLICLLSNKMWKCWGEPWLSCLGKTTTFCCRKVWYKDFWASSHWCPPTTISSFMGKAEYKFDQICVCCSFHSLVTWFQASMSCKWWMMHRSATMKTVTMLWVMLPFTLIVMTETETLTRQKLLASAVAFASDWQIQEFQLNLTRTS